VDTKAMSDMKPKTIGRLGFGLISVLIIVPLDFCVGVLLKVCLDGATTAVEGTAMAGLILSIFAHWALISRRANDINKSPAFLVVASFIPLVCLIVWLYLVITPSTNHNHQRTTNKPDDWVDASPEEDPASVDDNISASILKEMQEEVRDRCKRNGK